MNKTIITQIVRLICDTTETQMILYACHCDPTSGHLGIKRTIQRIRERFTWKGLNKEVITLVGIFIAISIHVSFWLEFIYFHIC